MGACRGGERQAPAPPREAQESRPTHITLRYQVFEFRFSPSRTRQFVGHWYQATEPPSAGQKVRYGKVTGLRRFIYECLWYITVETPKRYTDVAKVGTV